MRYLILTPNVRGNDGVSCLTRRVGIAIAELGSAVEIWSLTDDDSSVFELARQGLHVRGARGSQARAIMWSLTGFLRDCRELSVVVTHAHLAPLSLPFRRRGARVFQVLLGIEVWKPLTAWQTMAFRASDRLVSISAHTRDRFHGANSGFDRSTVCHLGLPDRPLGGELGDDGFALIVGRMAACERYKGHDALLDVWPDVLRDAPDAKLVIAGDGDDRERLESKTRELDLSDAVRFTGPVSDEELDCLYRRCAFFAMPSVNEGFGLVFLEAMRASKPCVGGVGAASEIIEDGTTGFVLDPAGGDALTRTLVDLFNQPDRRAEMGERGRERFERHFTSEQFKKRLRKALAHP